MLHCYAPAKTPNRNPSMRQVVLLATCLMLTAGLISGCADGDTKDTMDTTDRTEKNLGPARASHSRASRHEKRQYRHFRNRCATDCHAEVTGRHIAHPAAHTADLRQLRT